MIIFAGKQQMNKLGKQQMNKLWNADMGRVFRMCGACCLIFCGFAVKATDGGNEGLMDDSASIIWSDHLTAEWHDCYPIGNGVIGGMVGVSKGETHIQFNHCRVWTGKPHCYDHDGAADILPELRRLIFSGQSKEADVLARGAFLSVPLRQMAYQPCGDLKISFCGNMSAVRRELRLPEARHLAQFTLDDARISQESFAPYSESDFLFHRISADRSGAVSCEVSLETKQKLAKVSAVGNLLRIDGKVQEDGVAFAVRATVEARGAAAELEARNGCVCVRSADSVEIRLTVATNVRSWKELAGDPASDCETAVKRVRDKSFEEVRERHLKTFGKLYSGASIRLPAKPGLAELPTEVRLARQTEEGDPGFVKLLFDFGRYLLICSSRPSGGEPANLQGIWNDMLKPPWESKYTTNINVEMNYWPAETTALGDCAQPLFRAIREIAESGARTARTHYGVGGWVLHHNFDLWRGTAPINNAQQGIWPTGGAWLCLHLWEHWLFTQDRAFLSDAWDPMLGAARFFTEALVRHPKTGKLVTCPSNSPEHGTLCAGPAIDSQLIRALYRAVLEGANVLGKEADPIVTKVRSQLPELERDRIGRWGQLQEWIEDLDDPKDEHRHLSHLWAVYPGNEITPETPELFAAAKKSMMARGDAATGWSRAWKVNIWARFRDGDHALRVLDNLCHPAVSMEREPVKARLHVASGLYPNLLGSCPPFQIDGNFGACAGVAEMLIQSHRTNARGEPIIEILPALPKAWSADGGFRGLHARGAVTVDCSWKDGVPSEVRVRAHKGTRPDVRFMDRPFGFKMVE